MRIISIVLLTLLSQNLVAQKFDRGLKGMNLGISSIHPPWIAIGGIKSGKLINVSGPIPNRPATYFTFTEGITDVDFFCFLPKDSVNFYRYNVIVDDTRWLVENGVPAAGRYKSQLAKTLPKTIPRKNIVMPSTMFKNAVPAKLGHFDVTGKKITIELYKTDGTSARQTTTLFNKPIDKAVLLSVKPKAYGIGISHGNDLIKHNQTELKNGSKIKLNGHFMITGLALNIKHSELTFLYHVYLTNFKTGRTLPIPASSSFDPINANPSLIVESSYFQNPGEYELSIAPSFNQGHDKNYLKDVPRFRFTVLPSARTYTKKQMVSLIGIATATSIVLAFLVTTLVVRYYKRGIKNGSRQKSYKKNLRS